LSQGVEHAVIEQVAEESGPDGLIVLVLSVRPDARRRRRCSRCGARCRGYDQGEGRRRWRGLDNGAVMVFLEAEAPRVACRRCGVVVAAVPWARPGSRFTRFFEETAAWLAANMAGTKVAAFLRTTWRSVQSMVARVVADLAGRRDALAGLRKIAVDEISYRKGRRFLTVVLNHQTGTIVWAAEGRSGDTLRAFFDDLGAERAKLLTHVSADGAEWIHTPVRERAPQAVLCLDPFHVVMWATKALEDLRRSMAADLRRRGRSGQASTIKGTRWALIKNPEDLSTDQRTTLAGLQHTNKRLYRGYLMKEQLRQIFKVRADGGRGLLAGLIGWCSRSRCPQFVKLGKTLTKYRELIWNTLEHGLTNARLEATNTHLRALTKRAYGFHSPDALIAMAMLTRGGCCPELPGRS
jgi:transposase